MKNSRFFFFCCQSPLFPKWDALYCAAMRRNAAKSHKNAKCKCEKSAAYFRAAPESPTLKASLVAALVYTAALPAVAIFYLLCGQIREGVADAQCLPTYATS